MSFTVNRHALFTVGILACTLLAAKVSDRRTPESLAEPLESIPSELGEWRVAEDSKLTEETEQVLGATSYLSRQYERDDRWLDLFVAYYSMQQAGETMHSPKNCLPGSGWEIWNYGSAEVQTTDGRVETINKYYIQKGQSRLIVFYWYQNRDRVVASEYYAKLCLIYDSVVKRRTSGSIVRLMLPDADWAEDEGAALAGQLIPMIDERMPES